MTGGQRVERWLQEHGLELVTEKTELISLTGKHEKTFWQQQIIIYHAGEH